VYSKVSPIRGLLDLSRSLREWEKWLTGWSCQSSYLMCMMYSISQLKKGFGPHDKEPLPLNDLNVKGDLTIVEHPIRILETVTRVAQNSVIKMCKVQWSNHAEDEAT
jgi:hypothetical protein